MATTRPTRSFNPLPADGETHPVRSRMCASCIYRPFQSAPRRRGDPPSGTGAVSASGRSCFNPLPADGETHLQRNQPNVAKDPRFQSAPRRRGDPPAPERVYAVLHVGAVSIRSPPTGRPTVRASAPRRRSRNPRFNPLPADGETHRRRSASGVPCAGGFNPLPADGETHLAMAKLPTVIDHVFQSAPRRRGDPPGWRRRRRVAYRPCFNPLPADGETHRQFSGQPRRAGRRFNPLPADGETHLRHAEPRRIQIPAVSIRSPPTGRPTRLPRGSGRGGPWVSIRSPPTGRPTSRRRLTTVPSARPFQSAPRRRGDPPRRAERPHAQPRDRVSIRSPPTGRPTPKPCG